LRIRRSYGFWPELSAIDRHGELELHGVVWQAGLGAGQLSAVSVLAAGSQFAGGKVPGCVAHEPPLVVDDGGGGTDGVLEQAPKRIDAPTASAPTAHTEAPANVQVMIRIPKPPSNELAGKRYLKMGQGGGLSPTLATPPPLNHRPRLSNGSSPTDFVRRRGVIDRKPPGEVCPRE
jgi:hypothetical protein